MLKAESSTECRRSRAGHGRGSALTLGVNGDRMSFPVEASCRGSALARESAIRTLRMEVEMISDLARSAVSRVRGHAVIVGRGDFLPRFGPGAMAPEVGVDSARILLPSLPQSRARPNKAPEPTPTSVMPPANEIQIE